MPSCAGEIEALKASGTTPGLAVVLVGDDPASRAYVRSKDKMCRELGLHSVKLELPADTTQDDLLARVDELNRDPAIHGILVQSPPPKQIDEAAIIRALDPAKDVDGFHPINIAKLALGDATGFVPCTPLGCLRLLRESGVEISGAHVVVLGRSMIVGKPLALLLMQKGNDATVTVVHSRTKNLPEITRSADIVIAAIGQAGFVRAEHVREGAVVIDVGINRVDDADGETRLPAGRRRRLRRSRAENGGDHAGARRGRADDDRDADVEHGQGRTTFFVRKPSTRFSLGKKRSRLVVSRGCSTAWRASAFTQSRPAYSFS